jgi:hypothetical protein
LLRMCQSCRGGTPNAIVARAAAADAAFDEANLVADASWCRVVALVERVSPPELVSEQGTIVRADNPGEACPAAKVVSLLARAHAAGAALGSAQGTGQP